MIVVHTRVRGLHGEGEMRKALDCETREGNRINRVTTFAIQTECYLKGIVTRNKAFSVKPVPGLENLPRSFWRELSSPFTEVYEVDSFATEISATPEPRPFFEDPESNITVQLGAQVHMHCRVQNLQKNLKVSAM
uniref:Uncharacterized protein n=1 Tax=Vespula pensylvanica TaxID=30213 RepID=A0A834UA57_VESPE|nr:hypothetical protein H0235_007821 [Vespula pensylvanica]